MEMRRSIKRSHKNNNNNNKKKSASSAAAGCGYFDAGLECRTLTLNSAFLIFFFLLQILCLTDSKQNSGLVCWTCANQTSNEDCNNWAPNVKCHKNQTLCKTIHRINALTGRSLSVNKFCTSFGECTPDRLGCQLHQISKTKTSQQQHMECVSCCASSYCNEDIPFNDTSAKMMSIQTNGAHRHGLLNRENISSTTPFLIFVLITTYAFNLHSSSLFIVFPTSGWHSHKRATRTP